MPGDDIAHVAVLDASIAVRWLVRERGSDEVEALMRQPINWRAPHLLITEVVSAMRRKIVAGELTSVDALAGIATLKAAIDGDVIRLFADDQLIPSALTLALTCGHKLPDCMYLALAENDGASIATADEALARIAAERSVPVLFVRST